MATDTLASRSNITTPTSGGKLSCQSYVEKHSDINAYCHSNIGIIIGFGIVFFLAYIVAAEFAKPPVNKGEVLVFRKGRGPVKSEKGATDAEAQGGKPQIAATKAEKQDHSNSTGLAAGNSIFHWEDLCYDIQIKGNDRRLLDHVDGWVKPGTSTALMVS